jgi:hypothetical protein
MQIFISLLVILLAATKSVYAVDETSVLQRYFVVGVISASEKNANPKNGANAGAIAVIKDKTSQRSLLLRAGDQVPYSDRWRVLSIERNHVFLTNDTEKVELLQFVEDEAPAIKKEVLSDVVAEDNFDKYYSFRKNDGSDSDNSTDKEVKPRVTAAMENVIEFKANDAEKAENEYNAVEELGLRPRKEVKQGDGEMNENANTTGLAPENYERNTFGSEAENESGSYSEYWQYDESDDDFYFE